MPKQKGILQLEGALGDLSFYHSKWGWLVRRKGGAPKERIASHPAFQRTRENNAEFAQAVQAARLLRQAFLPMIGKAVDKQLMSRLVQALLRVIRTDTLHERGQRQPGSGQLELLRGFAFNAGPSLDAVFSASFTTGLEREQGKAWVMLPPFIPKLVIKAPAGATHYQWSFGLANIHFESGKVATQMVQSGILPINDEPAAALRLEKSFPAANGHYLFAMLGIHLLHTVNGHPYPLQADGCNCLSLVAAG